MNYVQLKFNTIVLLLQIIDVSTRSNRHSFTCIINSLFELRNATDKNQRVAVWNNRWDESSYYLANCTADGHLDENTDLSVIPGNKTLVLYVNCPNENSAWSILAPKSLSHLHDLKEVGFWNCKFREWTISKWLSGNPDILSIIINNATMGYEGPALNDNFYLGADLQRLEISDSPRLSLPTKFLCHWRDLKFLNMHGNELLNFPFLHECHSEITNLQSTRYFSKLEEINLKGNNLTAIPEGIFDCGSDKNAINLAGNQIVSITRLPNSTDATPTFLEMQNNQLRTLHWNCDTFSYIFGLTFSNNRLQKFDANFEKCDKLKDIWLDGNNFNDLAEVLPYLKSLTYIYIIDLRNSHFLSGDLDLPTIPRSLKKLLLTNSSLQRITDTSNWTLTSMLTLQELIADHNVIGNLSGFWFPPNLLTISLSNNSINSISRDVFVHSILIHTIDLSLNNIATIDEIFEHLKNLQTLNLSGNAIHVFDYSYIPPPLLVLDISSNNLRQITDKRNYLSTVRYQLEVLNVSNSYLQELGPASFAVSLKTIVLNNCEIEFGKSYTFTRLTNLISLETANILLYKAEPFFLGSAQWQRTVRMSEQFNDDDKCSCNVYAQTSLVTCADVHIQLLLYQVDPFRNTELMHNITCSQVVYCHCDLCSMRHNSQGDGLNSVVRTLWCTNTSRTHTPQIIPLKTRAFSSLASTTILYLNNSGIQTLDEGAFKTVPNVKRLHLEDNQITTILGEELKGLKQLQEIFLSNNLLSHLSNDTFRYVRNLRYIYLDHNGIQILDDETFSHLPNIRVLSLHSNKISSIDPNSFNGIPLLESLTLHDNHLDSFDVNLPQSLQHFTLRDNRFPCTCEFVTHFQLLVKTTLSEKLDDAGQTFCQQPNFKPKRPIVGMMDDECYETPVPSNLHKYLIALSVCIVSSVVIGITIYFFRMDVQVWLYSRFKIRLFTDKHCDDSNKDYDVFMSYSDNDREYVLLVVQRLEEKGLRVCVHERDFPVGVPIIDTITSVVERSCRTLIVLTPQFVSSEWCLFEFQMAHNQSLQDRCCRVIVIMLIEVDRTRLNPEIRAYLRTRTYLKSDDKLFWEKLFFVLPDTGRAL